MMIVSFVDIIYPIGLSLHFTTNCLEFFRVTDVIIVYVQHNIITNNFSHFPKHPICIINIIVNIIISSSIFGPNGDV